MPPIQPLRLISPPIPVSVASTPNGRAAEVWVLSADVADYGGTAALVPAHIRYHCAAGRKDCIEHGGHRWWRVTHAQLGHEIGLSGKAVRDEFTRLSDVVASAHFPPLFDQSLSYRVTAAHG